MNMMQLYRIKTRPVDGKREEDDGERSCADFVSAVSRYDNRQEAATLWAPELE